MDTASEAMAAVLLHHHAKHTRVRRILKHRRTDRTISLDSMFKSEEAFKDDYNRYRYLEMIYIHKSIYNVRYRTQA